MKTKNIRIICKHALKEKRNQFCILLSGNADLVRYDLNGNRTIVEHFSKYDVFGEVFYNITTNNELLVEARKKSEVLFYSYEDIRQKCRSNCKFHQILSENLPELILGKVMDLNMRIELLTKRSIRDKLLGFFNLISTRNLSKSFTLPFSLTDLADYLSIDRSAMMRELKLLKEDGFIETTAGKGCFVSAQNQDFYLEEQQKRIEEHFTEAIEIAKVSGIKLDQLQSLLSLLYEED